MEGRVNFVSIFRLFLGVALSLLSLHAMGGGKGFTVVFMDIGGDDFYNSKVFAAFSDGFPDSKIRRDCWGDRATGGKSFDMIIKKRIPLGLTLNLANSIWNDDKKSAKIVQKIMKKAKSVEGKDIDGLYIINAKDGRISVMALAVRAPLGAENPSRKLTILWKEDQPEQGAADFDLALCRVSLPLDHDFSP